MEQKRPNRSGRPQRKPVGLRRVNEAEQREGYYRRWVNDTKDRISKFEEGWYEKVLDDQGNPVKRSGGSGGSKQVLMEIPLELYNEDQEVKQKRYNEQIADMLEPREGQYIPGKGPQDYSD